MGLAPRASARFGGDGDAHINQLLKRYAAATAIAPAPELVSRVLRTVAARPKVTLAHRYLAAIATGSPRLALAAFGDVLRIAMGNSRNSRLVRGQALALVLLTVMAGSAFAAAGAVGVGLVLRQIDPSPQALLPVVPSPESIASPSSGASDSDPKATSPALNTATQGSLPEASKAPPASTDPDSTDGGLPGQTVAPTPFATLSDLIVRPDRTETPAPTSGATSGPTPAPTAHPSDAPGPTPTPAPTATPRPTHTPDPPDATNTPRSTNTPHATDTPRPTRGAEETDEPEPTEEPDPTDAPKTHEPDQTDPPDDGDGGGDSGGALSFYSGWWWLW
jgi:hypothetical protein